MHDATPPVETADIRDADEILTLQKTAFLSEAELTNDFTIPPLTQTIDELCADFGRQVFFKVVAEGRVIGSVRGHADDGTCYIGRLIVHPGYRNQGVGEKLMRTIEAYFGACGRYEVFTGEKSTRNIHFYTKRGYRIFRTQLISDRTPLVFMEKPGCPGQAPAFPEDIDAPLLH